MRVSPDQKLQNLTDVSPPITTYLVDWAVSFYVQASLLTANK